MWNANLLAAGTYPSAVMVLVIGIVVVFSVLLLLTFVFWLFGKIVGGSGEKPAAPVAPKPKKVAPVAPAPAPIADGVPDEVVAVIAAAIASMSDGKTQYAIRRIRPAAGINARPAWAAAGIADNTRPF